MLDKASEELIRERGREIKADLKIELTATDHVEQEKFEGFAGQMGRLIPGLIIEQKKKTDTTDEKQLPGFRLKENITYSALPLKKELEPFLEALSLLVSGKAGMPEKIMEKLETDLIPARLKLYIALECPHCPIVVRNVTPIALSCPSIELQIIDGNLFPEPAEKDHVMSVPTLILDDDFRWTGEVSADEIVDMIIDRDPAKLSALSLKNILEQGDAQWIADAMMEKQEIFDGFFKLLLHETWSVRLGAIVVVEDLAEKDPDLAAALCPLLISVFDEKEVPVQGDILYILGLAGSEDTRLWIQKKMVDLHHEDLIEAAEDAIENLKEEQ